MVQTVDRKERGVGSQNFKYHPAWDEFVNIMSIHSPKAHEFLGKHFKSRTARNIKYDIISLPAIIIANHLTD